MKCEIIFPIFFLFLLLMNFQFVIVSASSNYGPIWLKPSAFAEYKTDTSTVMFLNGSSFNAKSKTGDQIVLRWTCKEQNATTATLQVELDFGESEGGLHLANTIFVDTTSRSIYLMNGTLLGTTRFWSLASPTQDERPVFWDNAPEKIVATIDSGNSSNPMYFNTVQGVQKCFFLNANGTIRGEPYIAIPCAYDFDTGVCLTLFSTNEPMLLALGVKDIISVAELTNTNIDLGPREVSFDIQAAIPFVAVIVAVLIVFLAVYWRLRKRKH
jgi:hypothetical protein